MGAGERKFRKDLSHGHMPSSSLNLAAQREPL